MNSGLAIYTGDILKNFVDDISLDVQRYFVKEIDKYLKTKTFRVFALAGIRRTGKTYGMLQSIKIFSESTDFSKMAYIVCSKSVGMFDLYEQMESLRKSGVKYFFIDEVSEITNYYAACNILSDIFCVFGRVVIAGTQSAIIRLSANDPLLDRVDLCDTTMLTYSEYVAISGESDIGRYIEYDGLLANGLSGYPDRPVRPYTLDQMNVRQYFDSAVIQNIVKSITNKGEPIYHALSMADVDPERVITAIVLSLIISDNHNVSNFRSILDFEDIYVYSTVAEGRIILNEILDFFEVPRDILTKLTPKTLSRAASVVSEYLGSLGLLRPRKYYNVNFNKNEVYEDSITYANICYPPVLRYFLTKLIRDIQISNNLVSDRIYTDNTIRGAIFEDIIATHLSICEDVKEVLKVGFKNNGVRSGEYDIVVLNTDGTVSLYEIKYSKHADSRYERHLIDDAKLSYIEAKFGPIKDRAIVYNGKSIDSDSGVYYYNASEFLQNLNYKESYMYDSLNKVSYVLYKNISRGNTLIMPEDSFDNTGAF